MTRRAQKPRSVHATSMFGEVPQVQPDAHNCAWPGCDSIGEHRAPISRDDLNHFHWFCLEHIRQYNKSWNYYEGMSDKQVEADLRDDTSWNRPSWPFAGMDKPLNFKGPNPDIDDFGGAFGNGDGTEGDFAANRRHEPDSPEAEAMAVLDLTPPVTPEEIKRRYKELVKRHHPDANGGDKAAEEKFKQISIAYATLTAEPVS
jgi:hypothetical protein